MKNGKECRGHALSFAFYSIELLINGLAFKN